MQFSIEGEDEAVLTDRKWVIFIFRQLLSNAVKYTPEGGTITVLISKNKQGIYLSLKILGLAFRHKINDAFSIKDLLVKTGEKANSIRLVLACIWPIA